MWDRKWTRVQQVGGSYQDMVLHREGHCDQGLATSVIVMSGGKSTRLPLKRYVLMFRSPAHARLPYDSIEAPNETNPLELSSCCAKATALSLAKEGDGPG